MGYSDVPDERPNTDGSRRSSDPSWGTRTMRGWIPEGRIGDSNTQGPKSGVDTKAWAASDDVGCGTFKDVNDVAINRRCIYPKQRVPKQYTQVPNYARIAKRVRDAKSMLANDYGLEHLIRHQVETIRDEEHILQIAEAMQRWEQELRK